tara:strand:- start:1913 stop:2551 length:639 start_codon:yes stop_codon:yes gene_type:complete
MTSKIYEMCDYDLSFKIIVTGDSLVGKSTLIKLYSFGECSIVASTIGVDFSSTQININDRNFKLKIWDTAGQERFRSIISGFYKNTNGCIIMFDLTNYNSFKSLDYWINQVTQYTETPVSIIIVGNKCKSNNIVVSKQDVEEYVNSKNLKYIEIDNMRKYNIMEPFKEITTQIYELWKNNNENLDTPLLGYRNKKINIVKQGYYSRYCCCIS